ncbi:MAG TPA: BTAD domain-containing putative transcriptional regulator [Mycobacteriales bacterium]|nr:BTAD domain-containing putative transcriptional regulator [Mycobacteriales bacterium]
MRVCVLGPLQVWRDDGSAVPVGGARLRALLLRLVAADGRVVAAAALTEAIWPEGAPGDTANALQSLVSRLRRAIGDAGAVRQISDGYQLDPADLDTDLAAFERDVAQGRQAVAAGDPGRAHAKLTDALGYWRGPALVDAGDAPYAVARRVALDELRLDAIADRIDAALALGRAAAVTGELQALVTDHPLRERFWIQLVGALHRVGRTPDALAAYEQLRRTLADELGIDPSPAARELHLALLQSDPSAAVPGARPRRTNLRAPLTSFVGRRDDIDRVSGLLSEHRLVTVVGTGGAGKTRLAGELAEYQGRDTWLVELAPVTDALAVPLVILETLGLREAVRRAATERTTRDALTRLQEALGDAVTLLILDNCEHLVETVAHVVEHLLGRCPQLQILATSREPLGVSGEFLHYLQPLQAPPDGTDPQAAQGFPAVQLLVDRARASVAEFAVNSSNVADVIEIVRRLDGLPLAIELAAARLRTLPVSAVAAGLSDRFRLLTGGSRTALPRHRTLRAVVAWSWDLLTEQERVLAERLAVFPAGATLESAIAVCADELLPAGAVADLLAALVDRSLLVVPGGASPRYQMLETIREYGIEQLAARDELGTARDRHARHFASLVARADAHFRGPEQLSWLELLEQERGNTLAALQQLCVTGPAQDALAMALSLGWSWMIKGNHHEVGPWMTTVLAVEGETDPGDRLLAQSLQAMHAMMGPEAQQSAAEGDRLFTDARALSEQLDGVDPSGHPMLGLLRPVLAWLVGRNDRVNDLVEEAVALDDPWIAATARMARANFAENDGDIAQMETDIEAAVTAFRAIGDQWGMSGALTTLARVHTLHGDLDAAAAAYQEALTFLGAFTDSGEHIEVRIRLAELHARRGDLAAARTETDRALDLGSKTGGVHEQGWALLARTELALLEGDLGGAGRFHAAALQRFAPMSHAHPRSRHLLAIAQGIGIRIAIAAGDVDAAKSYARDAYATALGTADMPIVAAVGVGIAQLLLAEGRPLDAARALGLAARIRGIPDASDIHVASVTDQLRHVLGDKDFRASYAEGRGPVDDDRDRALSALEKLAG